MNITLPQITQRTRNLGDRVHRDESVFTAEYDGVVVQRAILSGKIVIVKNRRSVGYPATAATEHTSHEAFIWSLLHHRNSRHENIHPLLGIVTTFDNTVSIVAEYVARGDAHDCVQDPRVDTASLLLGIAHALHYLHSYRLGPIYHGDVRGKNVLVTNNGHALLTDFSRSYFHDRASNTIYRPPLVGALRWMAPEGIDDIDDIGGRSPTDKRDVWAFAMTVLELFTGKIPFEDIKVQRNLLVRVSKGMPDRPHRMRDEWWTLCTPCWEFDPTLRPTMIDLVLGIERIIASRSPQGGDGDDDGDGDESNKVLISQVMNKVTRATRLKPHFSKTVTSLSSYRTQPISIIL
ncbi:hypothetical protein SCLCIDRAFT_1216925 [Scleroderma citrinum Foug A]|uniref:Protein kinase domain-containing protein n=1 Tax=Scleroderma citrinum Foug A TaxID=1036808 RepID=A0A0C3A6D2_9AGAM|nr:hypothetical protein SCLCIDRAFT_1216925 [Scleroderma citrinum Foug A]